MAHRMPKGGALPGLCAAAVAILTLMVPVLQAPASTQPPEPLAADWRPAHHPRLASHGHGPQDCNHCHGPDVPGGPLGKPPLRLSFEDLRAIADHTAPRTR